MAEQNVQVLLAQAQEAVKNGDVQRARSLIKDILAAEPRNVQAWLLATYLTNDPEQQRKFLDNAAKIAPNDEELRKRTRQLFPPKAKGVFTPSPVQPDALPSSAVSRAMNASADHIPTLADGVDLRPAARPLAYLPWAIGVGGVLVLILLIMLVITPPQSHIATPSAQITSTLLVAQQVMSSPADATQAPTLDVTGTALAATAIRTAEFGGLGNVNQTLSVAGLTAEAARAQNRLDLTATVVSPTQTAQSIQEKVEQVFQVGQTWQGEAIENGNDHYPMNLEVMQIGGDSIVFNVIWPSFKNTITKAEGSSVVDWNSQDNLKNWQQISGFDAKSAPLGIQFTEKAFVQGNAVSLGITYYAYTADGKSLNGVWNVPGSSGVISLTRLGK